MEEVTVMDRMTVINGQMISWSSQGNSGQKVPACMPVANVPRASTCGSGALAEMGVRVSSATCATRRHCQKCETPLLHSSPQDVKSDSRMLTVEVVEA
eukprot:5124279-Amphidinium_carterae.4